MQLFWLLITFVVGSNTCSGLRFDHSAVLDAQGDYRLKWRSDITNVTLEATVRTTGYIGLGFSAQAQMKGADILAAWVKDGRVEWADMHGVGHTLPLRDTQQNWQLLKGKENGTHTVVRFTRALQTCDNKDYHFKGDTVRVLWSYNMHDPYSDGRLPYHGRAHRGVRSLHITGNAATNKRLGNGHYVFELRNPRVTISATNHKMYWCQAFRLRQFYKKHHVVRFEPIIERGSENLVQHIRLYACHHHVNVSFDGYGHNCLKSSITENFRRCTAVIAAWSIGGGMFTYPDIAGFSLGDQGDPKFVWMETHYWNHKLTPGLRDSSGLRFYYTAKIRQYDAGFLQTGHIMSIKQLIPPHQKRFTSYGYCVQDCLQESLHGQHIRVFAALGHTHSLGVAMRTRHFRKGRELPPLLNDDSFDPRYQTVRFFSKTVPIYPGDSLVTECDYNTQQQSNVTRGGISKMCSSFLAYYPKVKLANCESRPSISSVLSITNLELDWSKRPPLVNLPRSIRGMMWLNGLEQIVNWESEAVVHRFQNIVRSSEILVRCNLAKETNYKIHWKVIAPPVLHNFSHQAFNNCSYSRKIASNPVPVHKGGVQQEPRTSQRGPVTSNGFSSLKLCRLLPWKLGGCCFSLQICCIGIIISYVLLTLSL